MKSLPYLVDVLSRRGKIKLSLLVLLWFVTSVVFWLWWVNPSHVTSTKLMIINSLVLLWSFLMPVYFFYFLLKMKKPNPNLPIPQNLRIAMIVTKAPSEPWIMVEKTLRAMISQPIAHDTWLADENPTDEVYAWCRQNGVFVSTRKNNPDYSNDTWPRRKKCKEGNLSYFYDFYGYDGYDIVVQLDADHVPTSNYLEEMVRPFNDPKVGYVSAPSICDTNEARSWAARGRLYAEATLHGPLQAGYTNGWAPLCIGSHYAVRTNALREIGGLGPELAEDHSTSLLFNAYGWRGVHAINAIAKGDGPETFADAMTQEFQWSRSLIMLLFTLTPSVLKRLSLRFKFQFLFAQLWYPLFTIVMFVSFVFPIYALLSGNVLVNVFYWQFLYFFSMPTLSAIAICYFLKDQKLLRPVGAKIISWESILFQYARWPWVLYACISALITLAFKVKIEFKVTPKGEGVSKIVPLKSLLPYVVLLIIAVVVGLFGAKDQSVTGYYYFLIINSFVYLLLPLVAIYSQYTKNETS